MPSGNDQSEVVQESLAFTSSEGLLERMSPVNVSGGGGKATTTKT